MARRAPGLRATSIRRGDAGDLASVARLMQAAFDPRYGEAWNSAQCTGMLALPGTWLTIAESDAGPAGFALTRVVLDESELLLLAIDPGQRRRGIGRALLSAVIAEAVGQGACSMHLEVRAGNPAVGLYHSEQFEKTGERRNYYRGGDGEVFDAHSYRRILR